MIDASTSNRNNSLKSKSIFLVASVLLTLTSIVLFSWAIQVPAKNFQYQVHFLVPALSVLLAFLSYIWFFVVSSKDVQPFRLFFKSVATCLFFLLCVLGLLSITWVLIDPKFWFVGPYYAIMFFLAGCTGLSFSVRSLVDHDPGIENETQKPETNTRVIYGMVFRIAVWVLFLVAAILLAVKSEKSFQEFGIELPVATRTFFFLAHNSFVIIPLIAFVVSLIEVLILVVPNRSVKYIFSRLAWLLPVFTVFVTLGSLLMPLIAIISGLNGGKK